MRKHLIAMALGMTSVSLTGCFSQEETVATPASAESVSPVDIAGQLDVHYEVVSNFDNQCQFEGDCFDANLTLTLPFDSDAKNWRIFFSNTKPIKHESSELFDITRINGDLHQITPTEAFVGFKANEAYVIPFQGIAATVTKNDVMPNFIYQQDGADPVVIASTQERYLPQSGLWDLPHAGDFDKPEQWKRSPSDEVPLATPQWLYEQYAKQIASPAIDENRVVPSVTSSEWQEDSLSVSGGLDVDFDASVAGLASLQDAGFKLSSSGIKLSKVSKQLPPESYELSIDDSQIVIAASDDAGVFYALQTLAQLYDSAEKSLPIGRIQDAPRFHFRGVHVDVARNYHDKAFLLRLIKKMGTLKFNKLHLHLAEDEAWRLEVPDLPELTEVGAVRCLDLEDKTCLLPQLGAGIDPRSQVNGYLSVADYKDVLKAAHQQHIEVIPSLDMPGHSRAAIQAMEARYARFMLQEEKDKAEEFMLTELEDTTVYSSIQHYNDNTINPCIDSSYRFIDKVLSEIKKMHDEAGVPLRRYHIGADETAGAWVESPACQALMEKEGIAETKHLTAYFIARVTKMVNDMGIMAGAWSDGLSHVEPMKLGSRIQANLWERLTHGGQHIAHQMANHGWDAVLSLPDVLYFDFPYMPHPDENGYYWGSRYTSTFQVFQFMPGNLPAHAEFWPDSMGNPYVSDDKVPLDQGRGFAGIQAQVWSETLRHESQAEYMLFPRLIAVAERAWHKPQWEVPYQPGVNYSQATNFFNETMRQQQKSDWQGFVAAMVKNVLPQLEKDGVFYRLPPAGGRVVDNQLQVNVPWASLQVEYSLDDGKSWQLYESPVAVSDVTKVGLRTFTGLSDRRSRTTWLKNPE